MKVSAVVSSLWTDKGKPNILFNCLNSLIGADEILALVTEKNTRLGFADSWNRVAKIANGDFLVFIGDNNILTAGSLKDLCIEDTITYPKINGEFIKLPFTFCIPRNIYAKLGLYDESFNKGIHWEDIDFWRRVQESGIKYQGIPSVNFNKSLSGRSIKRIKNKAELFFVNKDVYVKKWGDDITPEIEKEVSSKSVIYRIKDFFDRLPYTLDRHLFLLKAKFKFKNR